MGHPEFFCGNQVIAVIQPHAAVLFRLLDAEKPKVAELFEQLMNREFPGGFPFVAVGVDLLLDEITDGFSQGFVFGCEFHVLVLLG